MQQFAFRHGPHEFLWTKAPVEMEHLRGNIPLEMEHPRSYECLLHSIDGALHSDNCSSSSTDTHTTNPTNGGPMVTYSLSKSFTTNNREEDVEVCFFGGTYNLSPIISTTYACLQATRLILVPCLN